MMPGAAAADLTLELNLTVGAHMSRFPGLALTTVLLISPPTLLAQGLGDQVEQLLKRVYDHRLAGVRNGDTVIDVGGHLGTFTRFAIDRGAALVVAFEPEPTNLACLRKTFQDEIRQKKVLVVPAAAWNKKEELRFEVAEPDANTGMGRIDDSGRLVVQGVTIDETVEELELPRVDFIKMDIEGAERYALEGAGKILAQHGPRMALCIYHRFDDREVIPRIVTAARPSHTVTLGHQQAYFYDEASAVAQP